MEDLIALTYGVPAILILLFSAAILILAMNALFLFVHVITRLTRRLMKIIDKRFE